MKRVINMNKKKGRSLFIFKYLYVADEKQNASFDFNGKELN